MAIDKRLLMNNTAINNIKKAANVFNASVGISCGSIGDNTDEYVFAT
jgi:hypothetical protein